MNFYFNSGFQKLFQHIFVALIVTLKNILRRYVFFTYFLMTLCHN